MYVNGGVAAVTLGRQAAAASWAVRKCYHTTTITLPQNHITIYLILLPATYFLPAPIDDNPMFECCILCVCDAMADYANRSYTFLLPFSPS